MNKKYIILSLISIMFLLAMTTVCAEDNDTSAIQIVEDEPIIDDTIDVNDEASETMQKNESSNYNTNATEEQLYETEETETQPTFPGGDAALSEWVASNLKYPAISQEEGTQGRVIVGFVIEPDGSITNIEVVESVDTYLDRAATQLVSKMPKWNPGTVSGRPVRTSYRIPVTFRL